MWSFSRRLAIAFVMMFVALTPALAQNARIPETHGTSLSGAQVTLPNDLHGRIGVLVLGFSKSSGDVCKGWGQRLAASYHDSHDVTCYQMPVLESVPKLVRGMVTKSIKSGVPEAEQAHFTPIFSGESDWQKVVHYSNVDDAYILVVDGQGNVHWQTSGKVTDAGFEALKQQVDALRTKAATTSAK